VSCRRRAKPAGGRVIGTHEGNKGRFDIAHVDVELPSLRELDRHILRTNFTPK
jgi:hypothetical protein